MTNIFQQQIWTQEFIDRAEDLLAALLSRENLPGDGICAQCTEHRFAIWRCKDCTLSPALCRTCMRQCHLNNPLHRIECWTGTYFRSADLWEVGVYLLIKHQGEESECRSLSWQKESLEWLQLSKDDEEQRRLSASQTSSNSVPTAPPTARNPDQSEEEWEEDDTELDSIVGYLGDPTTRGADDCPHQDALNNHYVQVVHVNGIHHIALVTCLCHGAETVHGDLMYHRLVPTTFSRYRTLFTVAVLDDFRMSNLECKASAYQYFQKLRRVTFPMAPARAPNLYQELLRMARVWRWLKKKKWAGHSHRSGNFTQTAPGELVNFCPACPQPGVNLPSNWKNDPNR